MPTQWIGPIAGVDCTRTLGLQNTAQTVDRS